MGGGNAVDAHTPREGEKTVVRRPTPEGSVQAEIRGAKEGVGVGVSV